MSKIIVFSDTHGTLDIARKALLAHQNADYIFHLGDGIGDMRRIKECSEEKLICVRGNNDVLSDKSIPNELVLDIDGYRILLSHGHTHRVKYSLTMYEQHARELKCDIALFGHTHTQYCEYKDGLYLFNPGSASYIAYPKRGYGIIETSKSGIYLSHAEVT